MVSVRDEKNRELKRDGGDFFDDRFESKISIYNLSKKALEVLIDNGIVNYLRNQKTTHFSVW